VFFHLSSRHCHFVQLNDSEFLKYCRMMTLIRIVFLFLTLLFLKRWISQKYRITQSKNLLCPILFWSTTVHIFIFGGGNKRLRNVTKVYSQCQISHKHRKKECLGKFKFSLNRLKKQILRKPIFVSASKGKVILI
jgi:hypothetical protein